MEETGSDGGAYWKALLLGLWGVLVVSSVDNLLRPFVAGHAANNIRCSSRWRPLAAPTHLAFWEFFWALWWFL